LAYPPISPALLKGVRGLGSGLDAAMRDLIIQHYLVLIERTLRSMLTTSSSGHLYDDRAIHRGAFNDNYFILDSATWIESDITRYEREMYYKTPRTQPSIYLTQFIRNDRGVRSLIDRHSEFERAILHFWRQEEQKNYIIYKAKDLVRELASLKPSAGGEIAIRNIERMLGEMIERR
jgi:hypothetical protein